MLRFTLPLVLTGFSKRVVVFRTCNCSNAKCFALQFECVVLIKIGQALRVVTFFRLLFLNLSIKNCTLCPFKNFQSVHVVLFGCTFSSYSLYCVERTRN